MALPHTASSEIVRIAPLGTALAGAVTSAILKANELEVIRIVVPKGKTLPQHQVPGEITFYCIEGEVELQTERAAQVLAAGDFVHLRGGAAHALTGHTDASLLLTISLCTARDGLPG
ncbi:MULTISPECIES: cupin domain-containing protein [unclassified Simplicispira]|uniref:cupin domain-containing protein n=1 Tax=unclassified Simplicispira TaxID=2630407 RepID=UPI000D5F09DB|nr:MULTISPECIES: cupin domain-containing protein [unclassified Simplicispira]PVY56155.1 quercetin dioxygenase-like cupin family protein [Simplicispira sp. 125]REG17100.1 quercetin dioxygenase-like cupin family protein [Simplicispira sp. 110]